MIESLPALRQQFLAEKQSFYELPEGDPREVRQLSLEQLKKQAKELLKDLRKNQQWERADSTHPNVEELSPETIKLADSQWIIAREQGFSSWAKLKHHLEATELSRRAIESGQAKALDADKKTLHIRCGNDVMYKLAIAGFVGDFLNFSDPYIQGPVPKTRTLEEFIEIRATFISDSGWLSKEKILKGLTGDYQALEKARNYERVAFWFEHDAYDVLIFLKLLHYFSDPKKRATEMRFICVNHYPGVKRFNGIGQLPADTMRILWGQFTDLNEEQFAFGKAGWEAYTASTPEALVELTTANSYPLPEVIPALKRHIQELPAVYDGLSLTQRLTLQILHEQGPQDAPELFYHWYTTQYEPLVFMGDSSYWIVLDQLAESEHPAIEIRKESEKRIDWHITLTDFGKQLLEGHVLWTDFNTIDSWFGGVHNQNVQRIWYWDEASKQLVYK